MACRPRVSTLPGIITVVVVVAVVVVDDTYHDDNVVVQLFILSLCVDLRLTSDLNRPSRRIFEKPLTSRTWRSE